MIYFGEGVDGPLFRKLVAQMPQRPKRVDRHFFLSPDWENSTDLIIIPGGRDVPYHESLRGEPNKRIRAFVENGGSYLGICAGGYYASKQVIFEEGGELEVIADRELAFFSGRAIGPAYGKNLFRYDSQEGARIAKVKWEGEEIPVYFNGGCYFEGVASEVIATYADIEGNPAAIISCKVGKGLAVLSGVHPECTVEGDDSRKLLFDRILECLAIKKQRDGREGSCV